jgi:hypothetical protein
MTFAKAGSLPDALNVKSQVQNLSTLPIEMVNYDREKHPPIVGADLANNLCCNDRLNAKPARLTDNICARSSERLSVGLGRFRAKIKF